MCYYSVLYSPYCYSIKMTLQSSLHHCLKPRILCVQFIPIFHFTSVICVIRSPAIVIRPWVRGTTSRIKAGKKRCMSAPAFELVKSRNCVTVELCCNLQAAVTILLAAPIFIAGGELLLCK